MHLLNGPYRLEVRSDSGSNRKIPNLMPRRRLRIKVKPQEGALDNLWDLILL